MVLACSATVRVELSPDDQAVDRVWVALSRGDVEDAELWAAGIADTDFRARALADVEAARRGRAAVLSELVGSEDVAQDGSSMEGAVQQPRWLAARFLASSQRARARLRKERKAHGPHVARTLEDARRSGTIERREAISRGVMGASPGGAEGLAMLVESLLARRRYSEVAQLLEDAPDTARLRLLRRQLDAYTGALIRASDGLLEDLRDGYAVPTSVALLKQILEVVPQAQQEQRALDLLAAGEPTSPADLLQWPAERELQVRLLARAGRREEAAQLLVDAGLEDAWGGWGSDDLLRLGERRRASTGLPVQVDGLPRELRVDHAPGRLETDALLSLRLAHEWRLAARASYERVALTGDVTDLDDFLDDLDESAQPLGAPFLLADVPRIDYGMFGEMLDTQALRRHLPDSFVVGGKGLGMPPELTWYDLVKAADRDLPEPPGGSYEECYVENLRVPGFAASRGARFAGAGLDKFVFLDLDQVARDARVGGVVSAQPLPAWPAAGAHQRRDLSEPLDMAARLAQAARAEAGESYESLVLQALSIHERRHIIDVREFFGGGMFQQISDVISAGLLPGAVRAEVERRAQLDALREATDPRIPLAHAVAYLPVEGAASGSEHARGYAELVADFLVVLDEESWDGAAPLESYGLRRDRVLLQQLHLLPPEVIRSIARKVEL